MPILVRICQVAALVASVTYYICGDVTRANYYLLSAMFMEMQPRESK